MATHEPVQRIGEIGSLRPFLLVRRDQVHTWGAVLSRVSVRLHQPYQIDLECQHDDKLIPKLCSPMSQAFVRKPLLLR